MIHELDRVVLTMAIPAEGLERGDVGTVVHVYSDDHLAEIPDAAALHQSHT